MSLRRFAYTLGSVLLTAALLAALVHVSDLDIGALASMLAGTRPGPLALIVLLLALNGVLAGEKWRLVVLRLDPAAAREMPRWIYAVLSVIGVAMGQFLPVQIATALSRWIGTRVFGGRALVRSVAASLVEQIFDVVVAGLIAVATAVVVFGGWGARTWLVLAALATVAGFAGCRLVYPLLRLAAGLFSRRARIRELAMLLSGPAAAVADPSLTRPLLALSMLRFVVLVAIAAVSADAVGLDIPLWQLAAAFPFGMFGTALSLTPGGLGASEWGLVSLLAALGTPLRIAAEWAVACRLLVMVAALAGGAVGLLALAVLPVRRRGAEAAGSASDRAKIG